MSSLVPTPGGVLAFTSGAPLSLSPSLSVRGVTGGAAAAWVSGVGTALEIEEIDIQLTPFPVLGFRRGSRRPLPNSESPGTDRRLAQQGPKPLWERRTERPHAGFRGARHPGRSAP